MKKLLALLSTLGLVLASCETTGNPEGTDTTGNKSLRRNQQMTTTANEQAENEMDRTITQKIQQMLMADESLSPEAKNIKIMTHNGVVTLRGVVNNEKEKVEIAKKIKNINGIKSIDNQLEITRTNGMMMKDEMMKQPENGARGNMMRHENMMRSNQSGMQRR